MKINHDNIEAYIIDYIDGELDNETNNAVIDFIKLHPTYQAMLEDYKHTIMSIEPLPDNITFDKSSLYKEETTTIVAIRPKRQWQTTIAAALIIGLMLPFLWPKHEVDTPNNSIGTIVNATNESKADKENVTLPSSSTTIEAPVSSPKAQNPIQQTMVIAATKKSVESKIQEQVSNNVLEDINYLENQSIATTVTAFKTSIHAPTAKVLEMSSVTNTNNINDYFDINIPFEDLREEGIALIEKINKVKEVINNTTIIAKIGNKEIKLK